MVTLLSIWYDLPLEYGWIGIVLLILCIAIILARRDPEK
jgi:hypothetical protein